MKCQLAFQHQQMNFFSKGISILGQFESDQEDNNMFPISFLTSIVTLLHITSAEDDQDLSLRSNPGLHTFTYYVRLICG